MPPKAPLRVCRGGLRIAPLLIVEIAIFIPSYHICIYIFPYFLIILFATDNVDIE